MTAKAHRSRSTTVAASRRTSQNNPRPVSRASTVSVHSRSNRASPSPRLTQAQLSQGTQSNGNTNGDVYANYDSQFSQGTLDSKPYPDFPLDNAGMPHNGGMVQYDHSMGMNGLPNSHIQSFPPHFFDPNTFDEEERTEQGSVEPEIKRKGKGGKSIDKQMEEHVEVYKDKDITHIAQDVKRLEGTPESERPKLAFAIRWLQQYCRWAPKQNCPKNRVYRRYGERANIEGGVILNPASFGKCVKFVFRDLQTRRLGVRGESKYHYVDLEIVPESEEYSSADLQRLQSGRGASQANGVPEMPQLTNVTSRPSGDTAPFPDQEPSFPTAYQEYENPPDQARVFINPTQPQWNTHAHTAQWYQQTLKLPTHMDSDPSSADEGPLDVPPVWRYAPSKTDTDAANTLQSLYWNHCNSVIDAVRFCKERNFFHLFTSFNGTMTVPTQKLYNHVSMAPWIKEADWSMYKRIAENVSRLALEAVPTQAIAFLSNVANKLHEHIAKAFENHPSHVLEAKLEPAALFCNILKRMLKANQSAHAAARLLVDDAARDQMWFDVVKYVQPKNILETEVPMCGYEEVYRILTHDIRQILQPRNTSRLLEFGTHYQEAAQVAESDPNYYSLNTPIERIAEWLLELPKRFPQTSARTVLNCITGITGAIGRELTVENAPSLQIWFVVKCFIDDLSWYYAFHAGFCAHRASDPSFDTSQSFDADTAFMDQSGDNLGLDNAEDSGIGMSLLDDIPTK